MVETFARNRILIGAVTLVACAWLSWSRDAKPCGPCLPMPGAACEFLFDR